MQDILPDGGVIRKLWIGEADRYRDHLLRLDSASRHSRFGGGVSGDFIRNFVDLSLSLDAVVHVGIKRLLLGAETGGSDEGKARRCRPVHFPAREDSGLNLGTRWPSAPPRLLYSTNRLEKVQRCRYKATLSN